jgi:hypothetical protein
MVLTFLAQAITEVPGNPIKERIALGQHDDPPLGRLFDFLNGRVQAGSHHQPRGAGLGHQGEALLLADEEFGVGDELASELGEPAGAVLADADDVHFFRASQEMVPSRKRGAAAPETPSF